MNRFLYILLPLLMVAASCKKSESDESDTPKYTSSTSTVLVSSFALKPNTKILAHLDSVYFTIDTERMMIYNADSLPMGTDVRKLQVTMTFGSTVSSALFNIPGRVDPIRYTTSMTDSIDFSKGAVTLQVTSQDGKNTRDYQIMVNVHKVDPDTIIWDTEAITDLGLESNTTIASTLTDDAYVVLASDGSTTRLARTEKLLVPSWQIKDVTLPSHSFRDLTAVGNTLYCLGIEHDGANIGTLLKSDDGGETWTDTGEQWHTIIGAYDTDLLGISRGAEMGADYDASTFYFVEYPDLRTSIRRVPDGFPIDGMSKPVLQSSSWSVNPYLIIAGGKTADGGITGNVWSYDGRSWGLLSSSSNKLPALTGMSVVPYYTYTVNTNNYRAVRSDALYAFGGFYADGAYNTRVYTSADKGLNWELADDRSQMPKAIYDKHFVGDAYIENATLSRDAAMVTAHRVAPTKPITHWDCPFIYCIGKVTGGSPVIVNGVHQRLMFIPVY